MKPSAIVDEMRRASALVDEAPDHLQYQTRLIALALIARQFLRETRGAEKTDD